MIFGLRGIPARRGINGAAYRIGVDLTTAFKETEFFSNFAEKMSLLKNPIS